MYGGKVECSKGGENCGWHVGNANGRKCTPNSMHYAAFAIKIHLMEGLSKESRLDYVVENAEDLGIEYGYLHGSSMASVGCLAN